MKVVEIYKRNLTNRNYSKRTIEAYVCYLQKFLKELGKNPYHITLSDITQYLLNKKYSSTSQQNQVIGSLKLFAKYILNRRNMQLNKIERPRRAKKLPMVLSGRYIKEKQETIKNLKHRTLLSVTFACGMRVSEVLNLQWGDLDRHRGIITIVNAKGGKDRIVPLPENLTKMLENYYLEYRPKKYVFEGQNGGQYTANSCNKLVKRYIHKKATMHTLRHSCATYLHEMGTDVATLSKFLGHSNIKTTMVYTHVSDNVIKKLPIKELV